MRNSLRLAATALIALLACCTRSLAQPDPDALLAALRTCEFGADNAPVIAVQKWVAGARAEPKQRRDAARRLAAFAASDAPFDARQVACRELVLVAGDAEVPMLAHLLGDPQLAHYGLLSLARIPGPAAAAALRQAAARLGGVAQLGAIDALGERRDLGAVSVLGPLLNTHNDAVAQATLSALGRIGTPPASRLLRGAYDRAIGSRRVAAGNALLTCADRLRFTGQRAAALSIFELLNRPDAPAQQRVSALRGRALIGGKGTVSLVLSGLGDVARPRQRGAVVAAREMPGSDATRALAAGLPKLDTDAQVLLIGALADRHDPVAAPAVAGMLRSHSAVVRTRAVYALGILGGASTVTPLLHSASAGSPEERAAARLALENLRGTTIDAQLLAAMDARSAAIAVEAIRALGARQAGTSVQRLAAAVRSPRKDISAAAVRVLRDLGTTDHVPTLLDLMLTRPAGERDDVMDAISEITRRGATDEQRSVPVIRKLASATRATDRADLLTLAGQIGGAPALVALRNGLSDSSADVRMAAIRQLAEWPTAEPRTDLIAVVREAKIPAERAIALRGSIRLIGIADPMTAGEAVAAYKEASALATTDDERRLVIAGLAKTPSAQSLEYAASFLGNTQLKAEAELAVAQIGRATAGTYRERTAALLQPLASGATDEATRTQASATLALIQSYGDYLTAWEVSPFYAQPGADYSRLFDIAFAPEQADHQVAVPWRLMPAGGSQDQPWLLDLLAVWGGEQRVTYLRTTLRSDVERDAILEMGSDDGIKVWVNGTLVFSHNIARAVAPGQEKAPVHLKSGDNRVLVKVTQNIMGWGFCARVTNPDGSPATGVRNILTSDDTEAH